MGWLIDYGEWVLGALVLGLVVGWLVVVGAALLHGRRSQATLAPAAMFAILATTFILVATLRPFDLGRPPAHPKLVPFNDLVIGLRGFRGGLPIALANVVANIGLFVPWGAAIAILRPRTWPVAIVVAGAMLSIGVETLQAVVPIGREADITDVITNTLGTAVGAFAIRLFSMLPMRLGAPPEP